jgi:hypothetical protein
MKKKWDGKLERTISLEDLSLTTIVHLKIEVVWALYNAINTLCF